MGYLEFGEEVLRKVRKATDLTREGRTEKRLVSGVRRGRYIYA